jgi:signal peptidase I
MTAPSPSGDLWQVPAGVGARTPVQPPGGLHAGVVAALVAVGTLVVLTAALLHTTYRVFVIPTGSMRPTLPIQSVVAVDLTDRSPKDGDIVVFHGDAWNAPISPHGDYVKRVIGTGGETVACCTGGEVSRDRVPLREDYTAGKTEDAFPAVTVPPGRLWVMGDNRRMSADSRAHRWDGADGTIPVSSVVGTVRLKGTRAQVYGAIVMRAAAVALPLGLLAGGILVVVRRRRTLAAPWRQRHDPR